LLLFFPSPLPQIKGEYGVVTLKELDSSSYLKNEVVDAENNSCMEKSYVTVFKDENGKLKYNVCLICGDNPQQSCNVLTPDTESFCKVSGSEFNVKVHIITSDFSQIKKLQFSNGVEYDNDKLSGFNEFYFLKSGKYEA